MRKKTLRRVADGLLFTGLGLVLVFVIYTAFTYPWMALFARWGWVSVQMPDDPQPLVTGDYLLPLVEEEDLTGQPDFRVTKPPPANLTWLGFIKIPAIQVSENIVEGSGNELLYAVGHERKSPLPGQEGNCFLLAHRNYIHMRPFRFLDMVKEGDLVYLIDENYNYTYEVFDSFVVTPRDTWVRDEIEGETHTLTLMTCTPVITFTHRLIVRCRLIETAPRDPA